MFNKFLNSDLLIHLSQYIIEPNLIILMIGWVDDKYKFTYNKKELDILYKNMHSLIRYFIKHYNVQTIIHLHKIIYDINSSFRHELPTYIFIHNIFTVYPYISYKELIRLEYDKSLNISNKLKAVEELHLLSIKKLKDNIINELNYNIEQYNELILIHKFTDLTYPFNYFILDTIYLYLI